MADLMEIHDPTEHVEVWHCDHSLRINDPSCLDCMIDQTEEDEIQAGPILWIALILLALGLFSVGEALMGALQIRSLFE